MYRHQPATGKLGVEPVTFTRQNLVCILVVVNKHLAGESVMGVWFQVAFAFALVLASVSAFAWSWRLLSLYTDTQPTNPEQWSVEYSSEQSIECEAFDYWDDILDAYSEALGSIVDARLMAEGRTTSTKRDFYDAALELANTAPAAHIKESY